jgi:hypothetical protein
VADDLSRYCSGMQLADWLFMLLMLRSDDPHGRSALDVTRSRPDPVAPAGAPTRQEG